METPADPNLNEILQNPQLATMLQKMSENPEMMAEMMEGAKDKLNPDMIEQAKKMVASGTFADMQKSLTQHGVDMKALQRSLLASRRQIKGTKQEAGAYKKVLFVNHNRSVISKDILKDKMQKEIGAVLKVPEPIELSCSRLAIGPWKDKTIKVWYNPNATGKNRLTSRILGFPTGSELIIVSDDDLTSSDFEAVKSNLV